MPVRARTPQHKRGSAYLRAYALTQAGLINLLDKFINGRQRSPYPYELTKGKAAVGLGLGLGRALKRKRSQRYLSLIAAKKENTELIFY